MLFSCCCKLITNMETGKMNQNAIKDQSMCTTSSEDMAEVKVFDYRAMIVDFIAGANAGTACVFAGQPFDTVKVKMQVFPNLYKSAFECFKRTLKEERFRGLYAGTGPALITQVAENSILFLCYGRCQTVIQTIFQVPHVDELTIFQNACAGSIAAFITSFALCPTELIKCKLQAQHQLRQIGGDHGKKPLGALALTAQIVRNEGPLGLYRGFVSTCTREVGGYFFFFGGYQLSKRLLTPKGKTVDDLGPLQVAISGGVAGACFWASVFPTDVVKSRVQTGSNDTGYPKGFLSLTYTIFRREGIRALYKGLGPAIVRCFPANAALFLAYEGTERLLK